MSTCDHDHEHPLGEHGTLPKPIAVERRTEKYGGIFVPLSPVTVEGIEAIPVGSATIVIDWYGQSAEGGELTEEDKAAWLKTSREFSDDGESTLIISVPPVTEQQAMEIADRIMRERDTYSSISQGTVTAGEVRKLLIEAAIEGRMVES